MFKLPCDVKVWLLTNQMLIPRLSPNRLGKGVKASVTPPRRETQAGEYEVVIPTFPPPCPGWGSNDWCVSVMYVTLFSLTGCSIVTSSNWEFYGLLFKHNMKESTSPKH